MTPTDALWILAAAYGAPLLMLLVGSAIGGNHRPPDDASDFLARLFRGVAIVTVLGLVAYAARLWVVVPAATAGFCLVGLYRGYRQRAWDGLRAGLLLWGFAATAHALMFIAACATSRLEGDIIALVFGFTGVTPGDSPTAYNQAQYLWNFTPLHEHLLAFTFTDRPSGGGLITAVLMGAIGQAPVAPALPVPPMQLALYAGGWIGLNATGVAAFYSLACRVGAARGALAFAMILVFCPFIVFLGVGLWPKLLALSMAVNALHSLAHRRFATAGLSLGLSFLLHGSFIWFAVTATGFAGALALCSRGRIVTAPAFAQLAATALGPVAAWFIFVAVSGVESPLRYFYVYDAGIVDLFTMTPDAIKDRFYATTPVGVFRNLGIANFLRSMLPMDLVSSLAVPILPNTGLKLSAIFDGLYLTAQRSFPFSFGLCGFGVLVFGLVDGMRRDWRIKAAIALFLVLYVPGFLTYHRDWYPDVTISVFALIPLGIVIVIALSCFEPAARRMLVACCWAEAGAIFLLRNKVPWQPDWPVAYPYLQRGAFGVTLAGLFVIGYGLYLYADGYFSTRIGTVQNRQRP